MVRLCQSNIIFLCIYTSVHPSSIHLSVTLDGDIAKASIHPSVHLSVCLSLMLYLPEPLGGMLPNFFVCPSIHASIVCPFLCHNIILLLKHWAEFNQLAKVVRVQHYFSMCPPVCVSIIHPSVAHARWRYCQYLHLSVHYAISFQTTRGMLPNFSMSTIVHHPSIYLSHYLLLNQWEEFSQLATSLPLMVRECESNIIFPSVRRLSICLLCYLLLNHLAEFNQTCYITSPHG